MRSWTWMLLTGALFSGCAAARGSYFLAEADRQVRSAQESGAPEAAIYAWTMADEYRRKAWEEWGYSDFEAAEELANKAVEWAQKAEKLAATGGADQIDEDVPEEGGE